MKAVIVFALFVILLVPAVLLSADALRQTGGRVIIDIKPGESDSFLWGLKSDKADTSTRVVFNAKGEGSQFLTFPDSIILEPEDKVYQTFGITIPDDYPGGIVLRPSVYATEYGLDIGATTFNIRMAKTVTIDVAPNDDPSLRVDWDALKATQQEQQALSAESVESAVQPQSQVEPSESPTLVQQQSAPQIQQKTPGSTTISPPDPEMDPEPEMDFELEDVSLQVPTGEGGGCLIATATYGSELAPQVQMLREIRDNIVLQTQSGDAFMTGFNQIYYSFSPTIADWERQNPAFKELVKLTITPMITSLSILDYIDIETETQMLGWGLSIIALNLTMYVAVPTLGSYKFSKYLRNRK